MLIFVNINYANSFQVVRGLNLIRDCWDAFGTKPESVYIPRGTLQVCILSDDPMVSLNVVLV